jgi:hypothetical protein
VSDSRYRLTLELWAAQHVPAGHRVTDVQIDYDDGYDPTFTDRPASLSVRIYHVDKWDQRHVDTPDVETICTSISELLSALFAIEETP